MSSASSENLLPSAAPPRAAEPRAQASITAEDARLSAAFLRGETWAVEEIRGLLKQVAWRYVAKLRQPLEDLLQELFLEVTAALRRGSFRGEARLKSYLLRVANYYCLSQLRSHRRKPTEVPANEEDGDILLPSSEASPLESTLSRELGRSLARLFVEIEPGCRKLWAMILAGKSYRDMSRELGVAPGTLRVRVLRCRRRAAALWAKLRPTGSTEAPR